MADEARDASGHEQLSIVLRCISGEDISNQNQGISEKHSTLFDEHFIGLVKLDEFDAQTLTDEIVRCLTLLKIEPNKCVSLCFDG